VANLDHEVWINAPVATVYQAISSAEGLSAWWAPHTATETDAGLVFAHHPGPEHGEVQMKVVELEPDRRVELEVVSTHPKSSPASAWTGTHLVFEISERENPGASRGVTDASPHLTVLDFRHSGWDESSEYLGFCNFAWGQVLMALQQWCESK